MADLHVWLTRDGYYDGELDAANAGDDLATFTANAAKNGQGVIEKGPDPTKTRPVDRPPTVAQQKMADQRAQLAALRASPWSELTLAQQKQATDLAFQLGETIPGITAVL